MSKVEDRSPLDEVSEFADPVALIADLRAVQAELRPRLRPRRVGLPRLPWQQRSEVVALEALEGNELDDAIRALLEDRSVVLRCVGIHLMIAQAGGKWLPDAVKAFERGQDELVAIWLVAAIGRLGAHRYLPIVDAALDTPATFWAAVESLALLGDNAAEAVLERALARFEDSWDKLDVLMVVNEVGGDFATRILSDLLADATPDNGPLRGFAAQALGSRKNRAALPALLAALSDDTMTEKGRVLWALGALGDPAAFDTVLGWVEPRGKTWWCSEALKVLALCDPERARPVLVEAASTRRDLRAEIVHFAEVARGLGLAGGDVCCDMLADILRAWATGSVDGELDRSPLQAWRVPNVVVRANTRFAIVVVESISRGLRLPLKAPAGGLTPSNVLTHQIYTLQPQVGDLRFIPAGLDTTLNAALARVAASPPAPSAGSPG